MKLFQNNTLRTLLYNVIEAYESDSVALTGGALVGVKLNKIGTTYYGTVAAPATTGDLELTSSASESPVVSGKAFVIYQAAAAPTITGITDIDVTSAWDNTNKNLIEVTYLADTTAVAKHLGSVA